MRSIGGPSARVLGIDPGLTTTGFAVVERNSGRLKAITHGVIRTDRKEPVADRLLSLRRGLIEVIEAHAPGGLSLERVFFNANVKTAISVGQASGVVLATAAEHGLVVTHHTPTEVKSSVAGYGAADKAQVGDMVARLLGMSEPPKPADAADACALAICMLNSNGLNRAIQEALTK
jgi:crossover junction endodeoxyribonuclease RuvC